jgi:outer membrane protein assembly factor BamE (lipoprotein component of BamABCDE complex)
MKKRSVIWLSTALIPATFALWCYTHTESYCFFYPGIDTRYAPGYSESAFSQVTTGMTTEAVQGLVGTPLGKATDSDGVERWLYTTDGKCSIGSWYWADFAWLGRAVLFRDGRVVEVVKRIYYD